jgi:uncharacterized membrane protein YGL010W
MSALPFAAPRVPHDHHLHHHQEEKPPFSPRPMFRTKFSARFVLIAMHALFALMLAPLTATTPIAWTVFSLLESHDDLLTLIPLQRALFKFLRRCFLASSLKLHHACDAFWSETKGSFLFAPPPSSTSPTNSLLAHSSISELTTPHAVVQVCAQVWTAGISINAVILFFMCGGDSNNNYEFYVLLLTVFASAYGTMNSITLTSFRLFMVTQTAVASASPQRALLLRVLACLMHTESITETGLHLFMMVVGDGHRYAQPAAGMFFLVVVPASFLALRGLIAEYMLARNLPRACAQGAVIAMAPMIMLITATASISQPPSTSTVAPVLLFLFLASYVYVNQIDTFIAYFPEDKHTITHHFVFIQWLLTSGIVLFISDAFSLSVFVCLVLGLASIRFYKQVQPSRMLAGLHVLVLTVNPHCQALTVPLALVRYLSAFDSQRRFSEFTQETCLLTIVTFFTSTCTGVDIMGFFITVLTALLCASIRASTQPLMDADSCTQQFMDHAVKQKFANVATAVENALELPNLGLDVAVTDSLRGTLRECRCGYDRCRLASITSLMRRGKTPRGEHDIEAKALSAVARDWQNLLGVPVTLTTRSPAEAVVGLDWELLRLVLSTTVIHGEFRAVSIMLRGGNELSVIPSPPSSLTLLSHPMAKLAMAHVGAEWSMRFRCFKVRPPRGRGFDRLLRWPRPPGENHEEEEEEEDPHLPPNLKYAVLDDSFVSRKAVMHVIRTYLNGSNESMERGACLQDVFAFVDIVVAYSYDVCILDQHMDFEGEQDEVLGTNVALMLRVRGYRGKIVLHSADTSFANNLPDGVDAWFEKTASREVLAKSLAKVWAAG